MNINPEVKPASFRNRYFAWYSSYGARTHLDSIDALEEFVKQEVDAAVSRETKVLQDRLAASQAEIQHLWDDAKKDAQALQDLQTKYDARKKEEFVQAFYPDLMVSARIRTLENKVIGLTKVRDYMGRTLGRLPEESFTHCVERVANELRDLRNKAAQARELLAPGGNVQTLPKKVSVFSYEDLKRQWASRRMILGVDPGIDLPRGTNKDTHTFTVKVDDKKKVTRIECDYRDLELHALANSMIGWSY